jgi:oligopeptide/dipeptide ABC transporter ATP-binding protein
MPGRLNFHSSISQGGFMMTLRQTLQKTFLLSLSFLCLAGNPALAQDRRSETLIVANETGPAAEVFHHPRHPYTRALIASLPGGLSGGEAGRADLLIGGDPQSPIDPDTHRCRLFGRCPRGFARCETEAPPLRQIDGDRLTACHLA